MFWSAIYRLPEASRWQAVAALLPTGKLACLLSALLIFSARVLYQLSDYHSRSLDDQQLVGPLMSYALQ